MYGTSAKDPIELQKTILLAEIGRQNLTTNLTVKAENGAQEEECKGTAEQQMRDNESVISTSISGAALDANVPLLDAA